MIKFVIVFSMSLFMHLFTAQAQLSFNNLPALPVEFSTTSPIMVIRFNKNEAVDFNSLAQKMAKSALKTNQDTQFFILTILNTTQSSSHNTDLDNIIASSIEKLTNILLAEGVASANIHHFTEVKNTTTEPNQIRIFIK